MFADRRNQGDICERMGRPRRERIELVPAESYVLGIPCRLRVRQSLSSLAYGSASSACSGRCLWMHGFRNALMSAHPRGRQCCRTRRGILMS